MKGWYQSYIVKETEAATLAAFRILFGLMMVLSLIRFWLKGWIQSLYIEPTFFFSYYGFDWVKPIGLWTYLLFIICGLSALAVSIGWKYRFSSVVFFLSFTYIELMDKTTYLNHYYFVSLMAFIMIWLPAERYASVDAYWDETKRSQRIPKWSVDAIKLMLGIVYFYAGLAKLNSDWLFHAQPLTIWLSNKYDTPLIGALMSWSWIPIVMSWTGALYDLLVPFMLCFRRTRLIAYIAVIGFHVMTGLLLPQIGMFPYIMIISTLIFFNSNVHHQILKVIFRCLGINKEIFDNGKSYLSCLSLRSRVVMYLLLVFFALQIFLPFRNLLYSGELFWTEEGYRFSWRVMLMEKAGYTTFKIVDQNTGRQFFAQNENFLTPFQEKQMSFQPDFILEYAHFLKTYYEQTTDMKDIAIYADSFVTLNGRLSTRYIDPTVDLTKEKESFKHKTWILPFNDEIKGL
ncbi:HTTM domain-containing protein [Reichenbachiella versicolor]|uniref:HTTM domain-containing protein n=1 Tax=Reichenbachiella versicolor TaxID=1821036 RepID=UPI000D6E55B0|nr:HTTM domain-containing protein [Reichenbachiella versicolor]